MRQTQQRLGKVIDRITEPSFLSAGGIGNEIAFYIFDYDASDELIVREHLRWQSAQLASLHANIKVLHLNLLEVVLELLESRQLLDKTIEFQLKKTDAEVLKVLSGPVTAEKVTAFIEETYCPSDYDLVIISGVGSVWPILRVHSLLSCLHSVVSNTPVVIFYPGAFDGTTLSLFGTITPRTSGAGVNHYYRAFPLIDSE